MPPVAVTTASPTPSTIWRWSLLRISLGLISLAMVADFVFRGLTVAFASGKNDFLEVYTGAWLWRHGQNFYDSALATSTSIQLAGSAMLEAIVYPPSAFAAFVPFTFLPWGWANFLCLLLSLIGIGVSILFLLRIGNFSIRQRSGLLLLAFVLAFDPIHQAFHLANIALLVVPLCLAAIDLAQRHRDLAAGVLISCATLLKPQIGLWILLFYLFQLRKWFIVGAALPALPFLVALLRYPVPLATLVFGYRQNLQHHFGVGGHLGFTPGSLPFHVNIFQVVLYQLWPSVNGVSLLAHGLFLCGLVIWAFALWRGKFALPVPLAISSLIALSFISLYHSVSDTAVLPLVLCWAFKKEDEQQWSWPRRLTCLILLLMLLPGHSALMRITPHLAAGIRTAWWWQLFIARYFVWLLFALNIVLLRGMWESAPTSSQAQPFFGRPSASAGGERGEAERGIKRRARTGRRLPQKLRFVSGHAFSF
jgi:hypothetical protein